MAEKKAKKAPAKKAPAKKAAAKKAPAKKAPAKKAVAKKAPAKKAPAKKAPAKKAPVKKAPKAFKAKAVSTKAALLEQLKDSVGAELSAKATAEIVENLFSIISLSIKKNARFTIPGFGTFNVKKRKARTGRNPRTGDKIKIKASKTVGFKPTPKFKDML